MLRELLSPAAKNGGRTTLTVNRNLVVVVVVTPNSMARWEEARHSPKTTYGYLVSLYSTSTNTAT